MSKAKTGLYSRCFAWMMAKAEDAHGQLVQGYKRKLFGDLSGSILELGPGTGPNLEYFPKGIRWMGLEPNIYMHPYLRQEAQKLGFKIELLTAYAEQIPLEDASADAVVSTLVLCSVGSLEQTLTEIRRVLRPGGKFVFLEHVGAPQGTRTRASQNFITPLWRVLGDGCHPNRDILEAIRQAGFAKVEAEEFNIPAPVVGPHIAGMAYKI